MVILNPLSWLNQTLHLTITDWIIFCYLAVINTKNLEIWLRWEKQTNKQKVKKKHTFSEHLSSYCSSYRAWKNIHCVIKLFVQVLRANICLMVTNFSYLQRKIHPMNTFQEKFSVVKLKWVPWYMRSLSWCRWYFYSSSIGGIRAIR